MSRISAFAVSYEIVTQESAEHGDVAEHGMIAHGLTLREGIKLLHATRTNRVGGVESVSADSGPPRFVTVVNGMEFETGAQESRTLHIPLLLRSNATRRRIARLCGVQS